jgi:hypothetical protein
MMMSLPVAAAIMLVVLAMPAPKPDEL